MYLHVRLLQLKETEQCPVIVGIVQANQFPREPNSLGLFCSKDAMHECHVEATGGHRIVVDYVESLWFALL